MNLHLNQKVIIVAGCSDGIGEWVCKKLVQEGALPCILDSDIKTMKQIVSEIKEKLGEVIYSVATDLHDPSSCDSSINQILSRYKKIDALVNFELTGDSVYDKDGKSEELTSNYRNVGTYFPISNGVIPSLRTCHGSIINIVSKQEAAGEAEGLRYPSSNTGIIALTQKWAKELTPFDINLNTIVAEEGLYSQNEMLDQNVFPVGNSDSIKQIPLGNSSLEKIADAAVFLLSFKHVNGQLFFVDRH